MELQLVTPSDTRVVLEFDDHRLPEVMHCMAVLNPLLYPSRLQCVRRIRMEIRLVYRYDRPCPSGLLH